MTTLYKYRPYSARSLEMLIRREVYFATPDKLNDPYDCRISIRQALRDAIGRAGGNGNQAAQQILGRLERIDHVYDQMERDLARVGVLSLSKCPTNVVMWTHYGDDHRGFCAGFELSDKFTTHRNDQQIVGASDVVYSGANPFVEFFETSAARSEPLGWEEFWLSLLSLGMVVKAAGWAYEEEVRVLRKEGGPVPFSQSELTEIVFGLNISASARATLRQLLVGEEWSHVRFKEIVRREGFAVAIVDAVTPDAPAVASPAQPR